jgi:alkylation response protein AidB-like acyl-CoA dehydrogenase
MTAALQVGLAARMTELAVDYAKQREQFGKVIGSFQAVKHLCADMFVRAELARAALHSAAVMLEDPAVGDPARAVAGAKLLADEAATTNGRASVQVHGGMGFTWEVPVHFFLKRAWLHATEFGTADDHAEDLADLL